MGVRGYTEHEESLFMLARFLLRVELLGTSPMRKPEKLHPSHLRCATV